MSDNQLHGKTYEDHLKSVFPGSADHERSLQSAWDIEAEYDKIAKLPTSIKTTKKAKAGSKTRVELADARKFWSIDESYRMLVAVYDQKGGMKQFHTLYEFLITKDEHQKILSPISFSEVEGFHNNLLSYGRGFHEQCRTFAKQKKLQLQSNAIVQLNPKIDSKTQRRLQCSIYLSSLVSSVKTQTMYQVSDFYRSISVSFTMQSSEREFNK